MHPGRLWGAVSTAWKWTTTTSKVHLHGCLTSDAWIMLGQVNGGMCETHTYLTAALRFLSSPLQHQVPTVAHVHTIHPRVRRSSLESAAAQYEPTEQQALIHVRMTAQTRLPYFFCGRRHSAGRLGHSLLQHELSVHRQQPHSVHAASRHGPAAFRNNPHTHSTGAGLRQHWSAC